MRQGSADGLSLLRSKSSRAASLSVCASHLRIYLSLLKPLPGLALLWSQLWSIALLTPIKIRPLNLRCARSLAATSFRKIFACSWPTRGNARGLDQGHAQSDRGRRHQVRRYLSELEESRHENRGLAVLLAADSLIRKKIYKLNNDKRKDFPTFSAALKDVLKNHKQLWNDARSTAELEKFLQVEHEFWIRGGSLQVLGMCRLDPHTAVRSRAKEQGQRL